MVMVMRKTFFCAAFAGALGLGAGAAPVSLESAQDYVRTLCAIGVISGSDDGGFHPNDSMTRAQVSTILFRLT